MNRKERSRFEVLLRPDRGTDGDMSRFIESMKAKYIRNRADEEAS
jgi:hypothetical protein